MADKPYWFLIQALAGTVAFSVSGALAGIRKHMDIFGVVVLGLSTAVGGGVIRDLILGITPPIIFRDPLYALISIAVSVIIFLPPIRGHMIRCGELTDSVMLVMDSIGLATFTVTGIQTAYETLPESSVFLRVFVGCITGVGGGILRDVLAGDIPFIFTKHIYACASIVGGMTCVYLRLYLPDNWAALSAMSVIILIRLLSSHYKWNLPRA